MKIDGGMKLYELTINENGVRFRHANPNPLTANQKFYIILTVVCSVLTLGFFWLLTGH